jgi:hypothetical protein
MEFIRRHHRVILWLIPAISLLLHAYVLPLDLVGIHVWRQTKTQLVIDNFYRSDMNIFLPRCNSMGYEDRLLLQEFPIMQWLHALVYKVTGWHHIALTRLLSFVTGMVGVWGMYWLLRGIFGRVAVAVVGAWCYAFSPVFHYYTVNPMPDNFSLAAGIWSLAWLFRYRQSGSIWHVVASAVCLSLATLAKLPFVIFAAAPAILLLQQWRATGQTRRFLQATIIYAVLLALPAIWYLSVIHTWGDNMVIAGITHTDQSIAELAGILLSIITSMLPELLLNYGSVLFFVVGIALIFSQKQWQKPGFGALAALGLAVIGYFVFEINAITTVHDYYMFPFLPPLFIVVASGAQAVLSSGRKAIRILAFVCLAVLPVTAAIRCYSRWHVASDVGFDRVFYDYKEQIRAATPQQPLVVVGNDESDMILLYYTNRVGWVYRNDEIDGNLLSSYIRLGARYLYCTGSVDTKLDVLPLLKGRVYQRGNLRIYELKQPE